MIDRYRMGGAACAAAIAAGPSFLIWLGIALYVSAIPGPVPVTNDVAAPLIMAFFASLIVGTMIALLPCLFGTWAMALLGERLAIMRPMTVWGLVGATLAGGFVAGVTRDDVGQLSPIVIAMALTGATCAAIARWRIEMR